MRRWPARRGGAHGDLLRFLRAVQADVRAKAAAAPDARHFLSDSVDTCPCPHRRRTGARKQEGPCDDQREGLRGHCGHHGCTDGGNAKPTREGVIAKETHLLNSVQSIRTRAAVAKQRLPGGDVTADLEVKVVNQATIRAGRVGPGEGDAESSGTHIWGELQAEVLSRNVGKRLDCDKPRPGWHGQQGGQGGQPKPNLRPKNCRG
mmetsp:Transcript_60271/g.140989  ORF Transcript_60271/g.140989 Transcript_60271/m.140989 type:complete len:205 (-) Transcript_60271:246-860(-)